MPQSHGVPSLGLRVLLEDACDTRYCPDCGGVLSPDWPALRQLEAEVERLRAIVDAHGQERPDA